MNRRTIVIVAISSRYRPAYRTPPPPLDAAPKLRDGDVEGLRITLERCGAYCLLGRDDSFGVNVRFGTEGLLLGI